MIRGGKQLHLLILLLCVHCSTIAQTYKVKALLDDVPQTGFYKIPVTPELSSYSNEDLSDIRIVTDKNAFVPYVNEKAIAVMEPDSFLAFPLENYMVSGGYSDIVLQNLRTSGITSLSLVISNNVVRRHTSLSGSDDRQHWYIIADSLPFYGTLANHDGHYYQTINFPLSKYRFFRLKIYNGNSDPLQIIKAGIFKNGSYIDPGYIANPSPSVTQKDSSDQNSYVIITNQAPYLLDRVSLEISGAKFYHRTARIFIMDSSGSCAPVTASALSSEGPVSFNMQPTKARSIMVVIENKDDPPLKVVGAATYQRQQYLVAWLEKETSYTLLTDNIKAGQPQYDLSYFKKDIPATLPTIGFGALTELRQPASPSAAPHKNNWLWPSIIAGVAVLGLLTYRLTRDISQATE